MNKQKLRQHLHQKQKVARQQAIFERMERQSKNHIKSQSDIFSEYAYYPNATTSILNHHYYELVQPVINRITNERIRYNRKDNRSIIHNFNCADFNGYQQFAGIVVGKKYSIKNNNINIYVLLKNVSVVIKRRQGYSFRPWTDHLWIKINTSSALVPDNNDTLTVGIGDLVQFLGKLTTYRGYRERIKQTKYGVKEAVFIDSGYPLIRTEPQYPMAHINMAKSVHYNHRNNYLLKYYNPNQYPTAVAQFGNQLDAEVLDTENDPNWTYDNHKYLPVRPIIKAGMQYATPHHLILNDETSDLKWISTEDEIPTGYKIIGNSVQLHADGIEKYYQSLVNTYHWRYEDNIPLQKSNSTDDSDTHSGTEKLQKSHNE